MSSELPDGLRRELLDDFYAESDELIAGLRQGITTLEEQIRRRAPDPAVLAELFRLVHSLKGICAIAGVQPAEELAHAVEGLLRGLTKQVVALSADRLDLLLAVTERLNRIIGAHRQHQPPPGTADLLARLGAEVPRESKQPFAAASAAPASTAAASDKTENAEASARIQGLDLWRCTFTPSPALAQHGVNITAVRTRLAQLGPIFSAAPSVLPGGSLVFGFLLGSKTAPAELASWAADGVTFELVRKNEPSAGPAAPAPETVPHPDEPTLALTPSHIVRVDLGRLDDLMRITGEIIIHRSRLEDRIAHGRMAQEELKDIDLALARSLRELRAAVSRVRLVPVAEIFARMPYAVRDLARGSGKQARVVLEGQQTEIDKYLVERLREPLLHIVRNAFAHAVETPAERLAAGKPVEATLRLRARSVGDSVEIQVADDGRGIRAEAIAERAIALGLKLPAVMDGNGLLTLLCQPGFSTRDEADRAAGRGVGMAVVAATVRELGGTLRLDTTPGAGSAFTLRLPLTLSIADALIVQVATQTCAVPQAHVDEIIQVPAPESRTIQQTEVVPYRGGLLPLVRLRSLFQLGAAADASSLTVVVVSAERGATGLVVDRVVGKREVVIRTLVDPLVQVPGISGATELGDGRPILILDPAAITAGVVRPPAELAGSLSATLVHPVA